MKSKPLSQTLPLPDLPEGAPGRPAKPRWRPRWGVIALCDDEADQKALYEELLPKGRKLKLVRT